MKQRLFGRSQTREEIDFAFLEDDGNRNADSLQASAFENHIELFLQILHGARLVIMFLHIVPLEFELALLQRT